MERVADVARLCLASVETKAVHVSRILPACKHRTSTVLRNVTPAAAEGFSNDNMSSTHCSGWHGQGCMWWVLYGECAVTCTGTSTLARCGRVESVVTSTLVELLEAELEQLVGRCLSLDGVARGDERQCEQWPQWKELEHDAGLRTRTDSAFRSSAQAQATCG